MSYDYLANLYNDQTESPFEELWFFCCDQPTSDESINV